MNIKSQVAAAPADNVLTLMRQVCVDKGGTFVDAYDNVHMECSKCQKAGQPDAGQCTKTMYNINNLNDNFVVPDPNTTEFDNIGKFICASKGSTYVKNDPPVAVLLQDSSTATYGIQCKNGIFYDLVGNTANQAADVSVTPDPAEACAQGANTANCNKIFTEFINPAIKFLSAGVGIIVTIMIIIGGIQYTTAEDNPQRISAARSRIFNALLALLAYIFLWAFLQWIVPGGAFH